MSATATTPSAPPATLAAIRDRLSSIAVDAQTASEALDDPAAIDLGDDALQTILCDLEGIAGGLDEVAERLAEGMDPARLVTSPIGDENDEEDS
jgi:hypothetical protein